MSNDRQPVRQVQSFVRYLASAAAQFPVGLMQITLVFALIVMLSGLEV